jgi:ClpP class serine protease
MHNRFQNISSKLYEEPWLIFPSKLREIAAAFENHIIRQGASDVVGPVDRFGPLHPQVSVHNGIAYLPVWGILGRRISEMEMACGGFDTKLMSEQMDKVAEDPTVRYLVLDFRSPGGQAAGTMACAQSIMNVSASGKRVIGYASDDCCSAAYFLMAACDEAHADPDATVGSISTICAGVDSSKQWAKDGRELKLFATGKFKATGMPGKEWTPEEEEMMWNRVRKFDDEFKGFVRARRPGIGAESLEGQWWYAKEAPPGLLDSTAFSDVSLLLQSLYARGV